MPAVSHYGYAGHFESPVPPVGSAPCFVLNVAYSLATASVDGVAMNWIQIGDSSAPSGVENNPREWGLGMALVC